MSIVRRCLPLLALGLASACGSDGAPGADAMPPPPDADPSIPYPGGPYGSGVGDTIANHAWLGFVDGDDAGDDPFDDAPRVFYLHERFVTNDPGARLLVINAAAGWCEPCKEEAAASAGFIADYQAQGVRFVSVHFQDADANPANRDDVKSFGQSFGARWPTMVDSTFLLGAYISSSNMPANLLVRASDMTILAILINGYEEAGFRATLDQHLANLP